MIIIKQISGINGAHANQTIDFELPVIPDGWSAIPKTLESVAQEYLPFINLTFDNDGNITNVTQNIEAYTAAQAYKLNQVVEPTKTDRLRADIDYIAIMTGVDLL